MLNMCIIWADNSVSRDFSYRHTCIGQNDMYKIIHNSTTWTRKIPDIAQIPIDKTLLKVHPYKLGRCEKKWGAHENLLNINIHQKIKVQKIAWPFFCRKVQNIYICLNMHKALRRENLRTEATFCGGGSLYTDGGQE